MKTSRRIFRRMSEIISEGAAYTEKIYIRKTRYPMPISKASRNVEITRIGSIGSMSLSSLIHTPRRWMMKSGKVRKKSQCQGSGNLDRLNATRHIHPPAMRAVW